MKARAQKKQKNTNGVPGSLGAFFRFLRGSRGILTLAVVSVVLGAVFSYIMPQVLGAAVDALDGNEPSGVLSAAVTDILGGQEYILEHMLVVGLVIAGLTAIQAVFGFLRRFLSLQSASRVSKSIRDGVFSHIQELPFSWHASVSTGDMIQRATQDSDLISRYISEQFCELVNVVVMAAAGLSLMFVMDPMMALVVVVFLPLTGVASAIVFPKIASRFKYADEAEGMLTARLQENLTGVRVVRAFGRQSDEKKKFEEQNRVYVNLWKKLGRALSLFWASGDCIVWLQVMTVLTAGAAFVLSGSITLGMMMVFLTYSQLLIWPVRGLGRILSETGKVKIAVSRIQEIFDAKPEDAAAGITPEIKGAVEFRNVGFSYDGERKVLDGVSFSLPAGATLGILGGTGSGKSTLVELLNRLYEATEGEILIDGVNVRDINLTHLRKNVGLVLQDTFLFSKTVRENITLTASGGQSEKYREYAAIADLDESVSEFTDGYDTVVGEKGVTLSGGQKQRVAIARTLIRKPPVMIFDDSLSAVDTETDLNIRRALKKNLSGSTVILISHRITTLMGADKILVLEDGRIKDEGTHAELVKRDGAYKTIFELQQQE